MTIIHLYHSVLSMLVLRVVCVRVFVLMVEEHGNSGLLQTWSWVRTALNCVINVSGVKIARPLPSRSCLRAQCHNGVLSGRGGTPPLRAISAGSVSYVAVSYCFLLELHSDNRVSRNYVMKAAREPGTLPVMNPSNHLRRAISSLTGDKMGLGSATTAEDMRQCLFRVLVER